MPVLGRLFFSLSSRFQTRTADLEATNRTHRQTHTNQRAQLSIQHRTGLLPVTLLILSR